MTVQHLIFARHGNSFDPGDKVVWVGRETDLPLVAKGVAQAEAAARAMARHGLRPDAIYAASLQRTRRFADIVAAQLDLAAPIIDQRLDELDYGDWAGRSTEEILAADPAAADAMAAWNQEDIWPDHAGWGSRKESILAALTDFAADALAPRRHACPLVVSSNGILRFLPRLLLGALAQKVSFKMRTGHLGLIDRRAGTARLLGWDLNPDAWPRLGVETKTGGGGQNVGTGAL